MKPLFGREILIFFKILVTIHVYYSSSWAPSKVSYMKLENILCDFLWDSLENHKGFY